MPQALFLGIILGIIMGYKSSEYVTDIINRWYEFSCTIFSKVIFIVPVYIMGSMFKAAHEFDLLALAQMFGQVIILFISIQVIYIFCLYLLCHGGNLSKASKAIKNTIPVGVVAFTTMSSLVTLPFTVAALKKNTNNSIVAEAAITSTVNYHSVGELISIPTIALAVLYMTNGVLPNIEYT